MPSAVVLQRPASGLLVHLEHVLIPILPAGSTILLGLSGGVDSVVLLHLLQQLSSRHNWHLSALHVHHGISPHADAWAAFCMELGAKMAVPVQVERVDIMPLRELGIEAAARQLRHAALARQALDFVALAHHADDQAETLLLQLLRGAGVRGVSAMPLIKYRTGAPALVRPLLDVQRAVLIDYAQQHALQWVEDESNADDAYPRNFLRHRVLPLVEQRFAAYRETLARSARHFSEASALLDELAQQDAQTVLNAESLDVAKLRMLSGVRGKNLLRYFIALRGAPMPDSTRLQEILRQLCQARQDAHVSIAWQGWQICRYQDRAYVLPSAPPLTSSILWQGAWQGEAVIHLPQPYGILQFSSAVGQGISVTKLQSKALTIRRRQGGETIRPHAARPQRSLKNLLQEGALPPWQRDAWPLLFCGDDLVYVPTIAMACTYQAQPEEAGVVISWQPSKQ
ncbi:MAG: tRNA lysidine(34) synthetase TilS [Gallionellaceae bacterium]|nr:tRNA lysidine(34) synthetase TilS [Gallionellaceae bacterium]